jgi:RNA polymerase sigma-70 factor (ECF subfamily)
MSAAGRFLNGLPGFGERPEELREFSEGAEGSYDTPDLREVFRVHVDYVWRMARAFGLSAADADDATQEVFLVAHRRISTFRPDASIRAWLFGITRNVVLHHRRGHVSRARHLSALPSEGVASENVEQTVRVQQAAALLQTFLDDLDLDKRLVFVLAEVEGMTTPEIAEMIAVPIGTVSSRLRAARLRLERFTARMHARGSTRRHG